MKTCIFICKKRHDLFNLADVYDKNKYRFVCIIAKEHLHFISEICQSFFNEILPVSAISLNEVSPHIENEINIVGKIENLRLICLDEFDILTAASLREKFNIPGGKTADYLPFRNKIVMKEILLAMNIRVPKFISLEGMELIDLEGVYENIVTNVGSEFIVKPISGASSIETARIKNYEEFLAWANAVNGSIKDYEAEEFISGKLYHCDSFVKNGKIVFSEVSECLSTCLDYATGIASDGSIVLPENDTLRNKINQFNETVLKILNRPDGAFHHELFVKPNGEIIFLEIAARPGGGEIVKNLDNNFGFNLYEQSLRHELGEKIHGNTKKNLYHAWAYLLLPIGKIKNLHVPKLKSNIQIKWKVSVGNVIPTPRTSVLRNAAALITLHHPDFKVIYNDFNYLKTFNAVEVE